jgi:hypothetical protein
MAPHKTSNQPMIQSRIGPLMQNFHTAPTILWPLAARLFSDLQLIPVLFQGVSLLPVCSSSESHPTLAFLLSRRLQNTLESAEKNRSGHSARSQELKVLSECKSNNHYHYQMASSK